MTLSSPSPACQTITSNMIVPVLRLPDSLINCYVELRLAIQSMSHRDYCAVDYMLADAQAAAIAGLWVNFASAPCTVHDFFSFG